jgi:hypothetical protein
MNTLQNKHDALEQLIYEEDLSIASVSFDKGLDLMLVVLNTKDVLRQKAL